MPEKRTVKINIEDSRNTAAHDSLLNWLINNKYVQKEAEVSRETTETESATGIALITLILENTLEIFKLASVFTEWCRHHGNPDGAPIVVQANGMKSVLSVKDMKDEAIVRRALTGAPDPQKSRCVLIGVSRYTDLDNLLAVEQNLPGLELAITDAGTWGVPAENVVTVSNPRSGDDIRDAIGRAAQEESDTLLIYYAGHGLQDDTRGLLLTLPNASEDGQNGTIAWSDLAEVINHAPSQRRVVILDCCYSGLAAESKETSSELLGAVEAESTDTYILAASHKNDEAWSPAGEKYTAFTGELLKALHRGIKSGPRKPEFLSLNTVSHSVRKSLDSKNRPRPHRHDPGSIGELPYFRNRPWTENTPGPGKNPFPPVSEKIRSRMRNLPHLRILAFAGVVAVAAFLIVAHPWEHSASATSAPPTSSPSISSPPVSTPSVSYSPVGGVSLTAYCNSQGMTINGNYCLQPISLKAACNWQYGVKNLNYRFTSKDPNSAICYNSSVTHEAGITDMLHYCVDSTGAAGAVAAVDNPAEKGTWVCEEKVDVNVACISKYNLPNLQARKDSSGTWWCYK